MTASPATPPTPLVDTPQTQVRLLETHDARRCSVGESPVWRPSQDALYWVDIPAQTLVRYELSHARRTEWRLPERVGCIAFDHHGTVLAALESGLFAVTLHEPPSDAPAPQGTAHTRLLAAVAHDAPRMRFNDGRCDRQGRFWSGTMVQDAAAPHPAGKLYRYDTRSGLSAPVVDGLCTQNGLAWSPDGRTMYLSDSHPSKRLIWSFDYDIGDGVPANRRLFADLHDYTGRPDGAAIDIDGCYWTCANDAGLLLRFTPNGRLDRKLALPAAKPSMCAFGGPGFDTLFVTTIRPDSAGEHDGYVFALNPGVAGLPEPEFAGTL
ncbi:SMP-30/gluconolactonase/LRE family protein [Trinickia terrae]|uniref:SMP-30/gluconolactonase/LRE family protein n=1 Tax=Trinickia terrae TaxID=2571161 RepID=A0A4U1HZ10_9BURK|nr:SMP-30/gluconolactonase/LRE family protein [Trinickia terrae]TKC85998.1 SMP-30/gluconolactonase/LRE family protein [Trinickia terrae]